MKTPAVLTLVVAAALVASTSGVRVSGAAFTANSTSPKSTFTTAADFPPAVTLTAPADGSYTNDRSAPSLPRAAVASAASPCA